MKIFLILIFSVIVYSSECSKDCLLDYFSESYRTCKEDYNVSKDFEKCINEAVGLGYDYCEEDCFKPSRWFN